MISSAFLHAGIFHIGMNMMSLIAIGGLLENLYGSIKFLWITWLSILLGGLCYLALSWSTYYALQDISYLLSNSIGYSGVLFGYAAIESFHSNTPSRSIFGLFNVPTKAYPFILLIILQFMLPNISLFGHLGGLLAGILLMSGFGNALFIPSQGNVSRLIFHNDIVFYCLAAFEWIEDSLCPTSLKRLSTFRPMTNKEFVHPYFEFIDFSKILGYLGTFIGIIFVGVVQLVVTLGHIVGITFCF